MENNSKHFEGSISSNGLIGLYIYYTCLISVGIFFFFITTIINNFGYNPFNILNLLISSTVNNEIKLNLYNLAFIGSMSSSLLGASVSYIRKIYKMSLGDHFNDSQTSYSKNFGTVLYFIYRPIFAIIFSLIIFLGLKIGIIPILNSNSEVSSMTVDMSMFLSFFIGLNSGQILNILEKNGNKVVDRISSNLENSST